MNIQKYEELLENKYKYYFDIFRFNLIKFDDISMDNLNIYIKVGKYKKKASFYLIETKNEGFFEFTRKVDTLPNTNTLSNDNIKRGKSYYILTNYFGNFMKDDIIIDIVKNVENNTVVYKVLRFTGLIRTSVI